MRPKVNWSVNKNVNFELRTGEFTNQEYFKNLCDNFGTEKYRCDFVAGQARVNGTINLEEIWMNGQRGVHLTGIISSPDRLFVDGEHGFHVHASNDPSGKVYFKYYEA